MSESLDELKHQLHQYEQQRLALLKSKTILELQSVAERYCIPLKSSSYLAEQIHEFLLRKDHRGEVYLDNNELFKRYKSLLKEEIL